MGYSGGGDGGTAIEKQAGHMNDSTLDQAILLAANSGEVSLSALSAGKINSTRLILEATRLAEIGKFTKYQLIR